MKQPDLSILVTGQLSMDPYRLEHGNIGNYYILDGFFRKLRKEVPDARIATTFALSTEFTARYALDCLGAELFTCLNSGGLSAARSEMALVESGHFGPNSVSSAYTQGVYNSDIIIDFSGDIWGENACLLAADRFEIGLSRIRLAQLAGKFTALMCSSPGPFSAGTRSFAKEVYQRFDYVSNREPVSTRLLEADGFDVSRTLTHACPAFCFKSDSMDEEAALLLQTGVGGSGRKMVGVIVCGFNFHRGPHTAWPRSDAEYEPFAASITSLLQKTDAHVVLLSHSNGFKMPSEPFVSLHGSDFKHVVKMRDILHAKGFSKRITALEGVYAPEMTHAIIGKFDMLVSGRVHGAVAGWAQNVPTVVIDYGHEPKAHKLQGFAEVTGAKEWIVSAADADHMAERITKCWQSRAAERSRLQKHTPTVEARVEAAFKGVFEAYRENKLTQ